MMKRFFYFSLLFVTLLVCPVWAQTTQTTPDLTNASLDLLNQVYTLLKDNIVEPVEDESIWNSYKEACFSYLKEQKLSASALEKEPFIGELQQKISHLYKKAVEFYPQLACDQTFTETLAQAILEAAQDDYTFFISAKEYADFTDSLSGDYSSGVGIMLWPRRDKNGRSHFIIADLAPHSPAWKAGLKSGDELKAIEGKSLESLSPSECARMLKGANGTTVEIGYLTRLARLGPEPTLKTVKLTRGPVHYPSVTERVLSLPDGGGNIGLLRVDMFGESTNIEAERALRKLEEANCQGYILDLRDNPGGYTNAARDLCSKFMPVNSLVASLRDRCDKKEEEIFTYRNFHPLKPTVVLINNKTASAAEITAGALRANRHILLVGETSFGKNSSQRIFNFNFPPGKTSACKITFSHYKTPDNKDLGKIGLKPDYEVKMEPLKRHRYSSDRQLQKAIEVLKEVLSPKKDNK
ncbi:PDZ domain-containing protein [bacterium]|nr:PDZ domain-containing protein [bacterium]